MFREGKNLSCNYMELEQMNLQQRWKWNFPRGLAEIKPSACCKLIDLHLFLKLKGERGNCFVLWWDLFSFIAFPPFPLNYVFHLAAIAWTFLSGGMDADAVLGSQYYLHLKRAIVLSFLDCVGSNAFDFYHKLLT